MTRYRFGGDAASWLINLVTDAGLYAGAEVVEVFAADTPVPFYASQGGSVLTDFMDATMSTALTAIVIPGGTAYLPFFYGPEDLTELWFQDLDSAWRVLQPSDLGDRTAAAEHDINDLQDDVAALQSGGGGGGGGGFNPPIYQLVAGSNGWPANPDPTKTSFWRGPDQPPIGVSGGSTYMVPGDEWEETDAIVVIT